MTASGTKGVIGNGVICWKKFVSRFISGRLKNTDFLAKGIYLTTVGPTCPTTKDGQLETEFERQLSNQIGDITQCNL